MSDAVLFPFIDPAVQIVVVCAAAFILVFFLFALSDAFRMRGRRSSATRSQSTSMIHARVASNRSA